MAPAIVLAGSDAVAKRLIAAARACGATINEYEVRDPSGHREGEVTINTSRSLEARLIAYICINHLAWRLGPEFVMRDDFATIRNLVTDNRYGGIAPAAPYPFASWTRPRRSVDQLMVFDGRQHTRSRCHVVAHEWSADYANIEATVTFFGRYTHRMTLTQGFNGLWRPDVACATIFDWESGRSRPLRPKRSYDALL